MKKSFEKKFKEQCGYMRTDCTGDFIVANSRVSLVQVYRTIDDARNGVEGVRLRFVYQKEYDLANRKGIKQESLLDIDTAYNYLVKILKMCGGKISDLGFYDKYIHNHFTDSFGRWQYHWSEHCYKFSEFRVDIWREKWLIKLGKDMNRLYQIDKRGEENLMAVCHSEGEVQDYIESLYTKEQLYGAYFFGIVDRD